MPGEAKQECRDIRCSHSDSLSALLAQLRVSVLISTYQTGHLVVVSAPKGRLTLTFNQFERAMGIAVKDGTIAVCTRKEVWFLRNAPDIAARLPGQHDACFLARTSHFTDEEGVPIVAERDKLRCGLWVVDVRTGGIAAHLEFCTGVEEIFDVQVLPGIVSPYVSGPAAEKDVGQPLWTVPQPRLTRRGFLLAKHGAVSRGINF